MQSVRTFKAIEDEVQTFTDEELRLWNKGYLAAIEGLLDQIQNDQIRLLNKILIVSDRKDKKRLRDLLESRLFILDAYEQHYKTRLHQLERDAE